MTSAGPASPVVDDEELGAARLEGAVEVLRVLRAGGNPLDTLAPPGPAASPLEVQRVEGAVRLLERL